MIRKLIINESGGQYRLMIDNVAVAHARRPYSGDRRVYAVLGRFNGDAEYRTTAASAS